LTAKGRFRFENLIVRTGEPDVAALMAQLAANAAEIAALKAEKEALSRRVVKLEEELALARLHRFALRSESILIVSSTRPKRLQTKMTVVTAITSSIFPTQAWRRSRAQRKKTRPQTFPWTTCRERVEYDLPDDQKARP
jgi:hypothetical protein